MLGAHFKHIKVIKINPVHRDAQSVSQGLKCKIGASVTIE